MHGGAPRRAEPKAALKSCAAARCEVAAHGFVPSNWEEGRGSGCSGVRACLVASGGRRRAAPGAQRCDHTGHRRGCAAGSGPHAAAAQRSNLGLSPGSPLTSLLQIVHALPAPQPEPNATAAVRVRGPRMSAAAASPPARVPYTTRRSVVSMKRSLPAAARRVVGGLGAGRFRAALLAAGIVCTPRGAVSGRAQRTTSRPALSQPAAWTPLLLAAAGRRAQQQAGCTRGGRDAARVAADGDRGRTGRDTYAIALLIR